MKLIPLIGRILFSAIFIFASIANLLSGKANDYAASVGVPAAHILVPLAGAIALIGGLLILTGYKARLGGWLIVLFLVPVTFWMHRFWTVTDAMQQQDQMVHFMLNIALTGAALLIAYFGSGPYSIPNSTKN